MVTFIRNADGTIERINEALDAQMVQQIEMQRQAEAALRAQRRLVHEQRARERVAKRDAARKAKVALESVA